MSRKAQLALITGCLLVAVLQAPLALRSLRAGWYGAYGGPSASGAQPDSDVVAERRDATPDSARKNSRTSTAPEAPVLRAGF